MVLSAGRFKLNVFYHHSGLLFVAAIYARGWKCWVFNFRTILDNLNWQLHARNVVQGINSFCFLSILAPTAESSRWNGLKLYQAEKAPYHKCILWTYPMHPRSRTYVAFLIASTMFLWHVYWDIFGIVTYLTQCCVASIFSGVYKSSSFSTLPSSLLTIIPTGHKDETYFRRCLCHTVCNRGDGCSHSQHRK
jgi:hypothetical protein